MIPSSVPILNSSWSGTGTVIVVFPSLLLHDNVAAFPPNVFKTMLGHDFANFFAGEDTQFRHDGASSLA